MALFCFFCFFNKRLIHLSHRRKFAAKPQDIALVGSVMEISRHGNCAISHVRKSYKGVLRLRLKILQFQAPPLFFEESAIVLILQLLDGIFFCLINTERFLELTARGLNAACDVFFLFLIFLQRRVYRGKSNRTLSAGLFGFRECKALMFFYAEKTFYFFYYGDEARPHCLDVGGVKLLKLGLKPLHKRHRAAHVYLVIRLRFALAQKFRMRFEPPQFVDKL